MKRILLCCVALFLAVLVTACGSSSPKGNAPPEKKLNGTNYSMISQGMDQTQVKSILGNPTEQARGPGGGTVWKYQEGGKQVTIYLDRKGHVQKKDPPQL